MEVSLVVGVRVNKFKFLSTSLKAGNDRCCRYLVERLSTCSEEEKKLYTREYVCGVLDSLSEYIENIKKISKYSDFDKRSVKINTSSISYYKECYVEYALEHDDFDLKKFKKMIEQYDTIVKGNVMCRIIELLCLLVDFKDYFRFTHDVDWDEDFVIGKDVGNHKLEADLSLSDITKTAEEIKDKIKIYGDVIALHMVQDMCNENCCACA